MAQTKTIQLLRSKAVSANLEAAKQVLLGANGTGAKTAKDGEIVLVRYYANNDQTTIKSILGIYHKDQPLNNGIINGWTILEDVASSVEGLERLQNEVNAIETSTGLKSDGTKDAFTGDYVLEVVEANDSLLSAISKIADRIGKMDKTASAVNGQVVTTVSEANGVVSETKTNVKDLQLGGYTKDANATGTIGSTDTVNTALSKLENTIASNKVTSSDESITVTTTSSGTDIIVNVDDATIVKDATSNALKGNYTLHKLSDDEVTDLSDTNVKEAYRLQTIGGTAAIGDVIKIYKDSSLKSVALNDQRLDFTYILADGTESTVGVDVSKFLAESEFADGLQVVNHVVSVKRDSTSEGFLTVGPDGVKLSGVQAAIDAVKVTTDNSGATYVNLAVDNAGRALTLTNKIQSVERADPTDAEKKGLAEASDVKAYVDNAVANKNVTAEGDVYVSATAANNMVTVDSNVQNLAFTQASGSTNSTLTGTAQSLADGADIATKVSSFTNARINEEIAKLDSSVAATVADGEQYSVLTGVTEVDGKLTDKTEVKLAAVAKTGAAADVSITDSGNLLEATNVETALQKVAGKSNTALQSVSGSNAITVGAKTSNDQQISLKLDTSTGDGVTAGTVTDMLAITDNGLAVNDTWDCGTFD